MNQLYDSAYEAFLSGDLSWTRYPVYAVLVQVAYTFNPAHRYLTDLGAVQIGHTFGGATATIPVAVKLTGQTSGGGIADAVDIAFPSVGAYDPASDAPVEAGAVVLHQNTVPESPYIEPNPDETRLIAYIDTAIGLPVELNGGDVFVAWDDGPYKIFAL